MTNAQTQNGKTDVTKPETKEQLLERKINLLTLQLEEYKKIMMLLAKLVNNEGKPSIEQVSEIQTEINSINSKLKLKQYIEIPLQQAKDLAIVVPSNDDEDDDQPVVKAKPKTIIPNDDEDDDQPVVKAKPKTIIPNDDEDDDQPVVKAKSKTIIPNDDDEDDDQPVIIKRR